MAIQRLPRAVSAGIVSTSSVKSQLSVLKELIENSIDAILEKSANLKHNIGQIVIEIDKDSAGLEYLCVTDDGPGIEKEDRSLLCLNHTTSKIHSTDDLFNGVLTCGFRGEALNFIAGLSQKMELSTKTIDDKMVECWTVGTSGIPSSDYKLIPGVLGTTIRLNGLFKSTPVRYKFLKEKRHKLLKDIENTITTFALIYREIRFQLKFVKLLPGNRTQVVTNKTFPSKFERIQLLSDTLGLRKQDWLFCTQFKFQVGSHERIFYEVQTDVIFPFMKAELIPTTKKTFKVLTVNKKPLDLSLNFGKKVSSKVNEAYTHLLLLVPPTWYISFKIAPKIVDFNIEPEKSDILIPNEEEFIARFAEKLSLIIQKKHNLHEFEETRDNYKINEKKIRSKVSNFGDEFDLSNDEILIESLESTLHNLKSAYDKQSVDGEQNHAVEASKPQSDKVVEDLTNIEKEIKMKDVNVGKLENADAPVENNDEIEDEYEWSRSVYDDVTPSSDIQLPEHPASLNEIDAATKASASELNPWTVLELSKEIQNSTKDLTSAYPKSLDNSLIKDPDMTLTDFDSSISFNSKKSQKSAKVSKQMSISSYGTYQIKESLKQRVKGRSIHTRLSEISQNTLNKNIKTALQLDVNLLHRAARLVDEETWAQRENIPSNLLKHFVTELYNDLSYKPVSIDPELNDDGVYQFK